MARVTGSPIPAIRRSSLLLVRSIRVPLAAFVVAATLAMPAVAWAQAPLTGTVTDPEGRPVAGAEVVVSGAMATPLVARTDAEGRFSLVVTATGPLDIRASAAGLAAPPRRVDDRAAPQALTLQVRAVEETLVVSAAQVDQPLSRIPDSVTVLDGAELDARQIFTLGNALRLVPGITVAQSGGPGTLTSMFPRGGESDYMLVLVDGVRANGFGGGLDLSQVPLEDVERVEVVRGPQSAIYGSDAIGGVVQVVTRHGGPPSVRASLEGGGRGAMQAAVTTTGSLGGWSWNVGADRYADDGFTGVAPADGSVVSNDDAEQQQANGTLGWRGDAGTDVRATVRYVTTDRGVPGPFGSNPAGNFSGVDRTARNETERLSFGGRLLQPLGGAASRVRLRVEADAADYDLDYRSDSSTSWSQTRRAHGRGQVDAAISSAFSVSAGAELLREDAGSTFITADTREVPVERQVAGVFGEGRWQPDARLSLTAGLRAEHIRRDQLAGDPAAFSPRPPFDRDVVVSVNPKVAAAWQVAGDEAGAAGRSTRLHASVGTGIRPPDAFEIAFTDNPGLKPERSRSVDGGITQGFAGGAIQADATWFLNDYDDLIIAVGRFTDASRYRTDNISNARAQGVELSLAGRARGGLSGRASYTFLDTEIRAVDGSGTAPSPFTVGDPLLRRPRHQGVIDVAWGRGPVDVFAQGILRGETLDAEPNFGTFGGLYENPAYAVANLGGTWRLWRQVAVYGRVMNLFDTAYEDVLGYPSPGRIGFVGVRVAASR